MNRFLRLVAVSSALMLAAFSARAADAGYVDLGKFTPTDGCEFVEVNLHSTMLKLASMFVDKDDQDVANLIRSLKHVRVNVIGYNDATHADVAQRVKDIRHDLDSQGWAQMVTVRDGGKDQDVAIYMKSRSDDVVEGLLITVIDSDKKQVVLVNLVGNIKPDQIAAVGKSLHIDPLEHVEVASGKGV